MTANNTTSTPTTPVSSPTKSPRKSLKKAVSASTMLSPNILEAEAEATTTTTTTTTPVSSPRKSLRKSLTKAASSATMLSQQNIIIEEEAAAEAAPSTTTTTTPVVPVSVASPKKSPRKSLKKAVSSSTMLSENSGSIETESAPGLVSTTTTTTPVSSPRKSPKKMILKKAASSATILSQSIIETEAEAAPSATTTTTTLVSSPKKSPTKSILKKAISARTMQSPNSDMIEAATASPKKSPRKSTSSTKKAESSSSTTSEGIKAAATAAAVVPPPPPPFENPSHASAAAAAATAAAAHHEAATTKTTTTTTKASHPPHHSSSSTHNTNGHSSNSGSNSNSTLTHVYIQSPQHGWIPALQLHMDAHRGAAQVLIPSFQHEHDLLSLGSSQAALTAHASASQHVFPTQNDAVVREVDLDEYPNRVLPMQNVDANGHLQDYPDMVHLPFLHEAALLYNLKQRHLRGIPYTRTGDIVIAVNPYHWYDGLYTEAQRLHYAERLIRLSSSRSSKNATKAVPSTEAAATKVLQDPRDFLAPHVYEVSALSYQGLLDGKEAVRTDTYTNMPKYEYYYDQSILVSGESGAGKTETVKICLQHLASISQLYATPTDTAENGDGSDADADDGNGANTIVQRIVQSNPLLEAFGNAKTRRNDNSSRFGKYLQLQFAVVQSHHHHHHHHNTNNNTTRSMASYAASSSLHPGAAATPPALVGSQCDVYLLETNRVVQHDMDERNFHIFYQLLAAPDDVKCQYWEGLRRKTTASFKYVGRSDTDTIEGVHDRDKFQETISALALVGVQGETLNMFLQALCVVLQLGNIGFAPREEGDTDRSKVSTPQELQALAQLMQVDVDHLTRSFTERTFTTAKDEEHKVPLPAEAAKEACDALAKEIYQKLFLWITHTINTATRAQVSEESSEDATTMNHYAYQNKPPPPTLRSIGLLDIFGFEVFPVNRFEQLCINYANEKLQQKFTQDIFQNVQAEYEAQGIALNEIWYDDNTDVLDLIEGPTGLIAMLNEECVRPKGNDADYVRKVLSLHKDRSPCLFAHRTDQMAFAIQHYAGRVLYHADWFVSKNMDTLPSDLQACAEACPNPIIQSPRVPVMRMNAAVQGGDNNNNRRSSSAMRGGVPYGGSAPRRNSIISAATVWTKYRQHLQVLMSNLRQTHSRYIRCIKPNSAKKPGIMQHVMVIEQLRCAGVVAGITIARSTFPNHLPNRAVLVRYALSPATAAASSSSSQSKQGQFTLASVTHMSDSQVNEACQSFLELTLQSLETVHRMPGSRQPKKVKAFSVGTTHTYFRAGALEWLESQRGQYMDQFALTVQRCVRGWLGRKRAAQARVEWNCAHAMEERQRRAREREEQAEAARRAQAEREAQERREANQLRIAQLKATVKKLEKQIKESNKEAEERVPAAEKRTSKGRKQIEKLKSQVKAEEMKEAKRIATTKAYQEKKIKEVSKVIGYLKKQNKELRRSSVKVERYVEDMTENSERLDDNLQIVEIKLTKKIKPDVEKEEKRNQMLKEKLAAAQEENQTLRTAVEDFQNRYMEQAEARLALQTRLGNVLTKMHERREAGHALDGDIVDEVYCTALEAEGEAKCIMYGLDIETMEPDLYDSVTSMDYNTYDDSEHFQL